MTTQAYDAMYTIYKKKQTKNNDSLVYPLGCEYVYG